MVSRGSGGAAVLFAGYGATAGHLQASSLLQTLGQIGETLLATSTTWQVRRLSPVGVERYTPDRAGLKQFISELTEQPTEVAVLAGAGVITTTVAEPAIVAGSHYREYPDDTTLPLSWIRYRLRACRADRLLVVLSVRTEISRGASACLDALSTNQPNHAIAIHDSGAEFPAIDALLAGLCGDAVDVSTGTITMRSICEYLARVVPGIAMQSSSMAGTLATPPPLGGLWDLRFSQRLRASPVVVAARQLEDAPDPLIHSTLPGRFRIESELARGGFGTIYRARQLAVERDVAVKVLHAGIDPASDVGRLFVHEIQAVGRLEHPNVVRIHQADITPDGRLFFAMELLVGRDLQQIIADQGTLARERAIDLTRQLLAGLGAAHDAGLVHADVKPANAFVVSDRDRERLVLLDFGLARLRPQGRPADSAGGTPAYMAPEQLWDKRVDARSDLFSAALILVNLLTGWQRRSAAQLVPPFAEIREPDLRSVLTKALAVNPADRFQTAADFSDALLGKTPRLEPPSTVRPFRHLAPMTERDGGRLHGRERDVAVLVENVLYRRAVIYTAPSGTGKTSLLRAGLMPRLEALRARSLYLSCRAGAAPALAAAIWPGTDTIPEAIRSWHQQRGGKLVLILDQIEAVLSDDEATTRDASTDVRRGELVAEVLAFDRWPIDADVAVVMCVREDFLARLIAGSPQLDEGIPVLRLGPLGTEGARDAISAPLAELRLAIAPDLLDVLLRDLQAAASAIAPEMGWGAVAAVYPPHLQLACSALCDTLEPGEAELTLDHYRRLGGLDAIVGEYLDRVLETELTKEAAGIARDLFLALVTSAQTRAMRTESELLEMLGGRHGVAQLLSVLEVLRARGLLVRLRAPGGDAGWELIHDSLVPRVLGWIDRRDLARRRAAELIRHHLRRSHPGAPSLLGRAEIRELRAHPEAVADLEAEWARRHAPSSWTPTALVDASQRRLRRQTLSLAAVGTMALLLAGMATHQWATARARREAERHLLERDMGRFVLELVPFDWDATLQKPVAVRVDLLPLLDWQLLEPDAEDPDRVGQPLAQLFIARGPSAPAAGGLSRADHVEARGGKAFLRISGRGRGSDDCPPSIVAVRQLPGYAQRAKIEPVLRVNVPTCQASLAGTSLIPAGSYVRGGLGEPPYDDVALASPEVPEEVVTAPAFRIDRTEVTNAAFAMYAQLQALTGISMPEYPEQPWSVHSGEPQWPVTGITWDEARAYCRFLGKELPTSSQWEKSMRGGLTLENGQPNPMPRRNLPWGVPRTPVPAKLNDTGTPGPAAVGTFAGDVSPYGVLDMAGNVQEWTGSTPSLRGKPAVHFRFIRGGDWGEVSSKTLLRYVALDNQRPRGIRPYNLGMRCVLELEGSRLMGAQGFSTGSLPGEGPPSSP